MTLKYSLHWKFKVQSALNILKAVNWGIRGAQRKISNAMIFNVVWGDPMLRVEYQLLCVKRLYLIFKKLNFIFLSKSYINRILVNFIKVITVEVRNV